MRAAFRQAGFYTLIAVYALLWTGGSAWHQLPGLCHHHSHHADDECSHTHPEGEKALAVRVVLPADARSKRRAKVDWTTSEPHPHKHQNRENCSDRCLTQDRSDSHHAPLPLHDDDCQLCRWYVQSQVTVAAADIPRVSECCDVLSSARASSPLIPAILCYETRGPPAGC